MGTLKISQSPWSQRPVRMSNSAVRLAFVKSVTCRRPPVSLQMRKLSTVPKAMCPDSAASRSCGTRSRIHSSLVAEK